MLNLGFILIALIAPALYIVATGKPSAGLIAYLLWVLVVCTLCYNGFFNITDTLPPRMLLVIAPAIVFVIYNYKTIHTQQLDYPLLISLHILRIPVEITLYRLCLLGKLPLIMTFKGYNFDILMGVSAIAILLWWLLVKGRINAAIFKLWNIAGILFLAIIVSMAILSAPSPIQLLAFDQPNVALLQFPFVLLPALVVPLVLLSHLLCLKKYK